MVKSNQKEQKSTADSSQIQPEISGIPEKQIEQVPKEPSPLEVPLEKEVPAEVPEKQIEQIKEQVAETEDITQKPKPAPVSALMKDEELVQDLKDVMNLDKPKQVKVLVYLAFKKGVHHAANIAKKLKDPYLMDEFHDTLVSELYSLLIKKKKIKQK